MKRPLPLILFSFIAGILAGSYMPIPLSWALAGVMGAGMGLVICLAGGQRKIALVFSPAIFIFFGFLFIGRIL